ncbi:MAG: hypothetical protein HYV14_03040 [Elusimicrobia bacterium]|nr:hypothetical protein [Elusimicrobiota bacterium]
MPSLKTPRAALAAALLALTTSAQAASPGGVDPETRGKLVAAMKGSYSLPVEPGESEKAGEWAFRAAREGIYEVDANPDKDGFANADFAVDGDGKLVLSYASLFSSGDYDQLLSGAGVTESKDGRGRVLMFRSGAPIPAFDAFCLVAKERFLRKYAKTAQERDELERLLASRGWIPIGARSILRGPGPIALKVLQTEPFLLGEILVGASGGQIVPNTFADVLLALQPQTQLVPSVGVGRRRGN